jgi:GntR family transcriptional repressor for pyruvate dehydrogenase complex
MVQLQPVQRTRVSDLVTEQILDLISSGKLKPGAKLPSEADLMAQTGVGRPSLRSALHALEAMNIIEIRQGVGAFVCEVDAPIISMGNDISKLFSQRSILEAIAVRCMLKPEIAAAAAQAASDDDLERLRDALRALDGAAAEDSYPKSEHVAFHLCVAEVTHNLLLVRIEHFLISLWEEGLERVFDLRPVDRGDATRITSEHQPLYDAIAARDSVGARQCMFEHVSITADRLALLEQPWRSGSAQDERTSGRGADRQKPTRYLARAGDLV